MPQTESQCYHYCNIQFHQQILTVAELPQILLIIRVMNDAFLKIGKCVNIFCDY